MKHAIGLLPLALFLACGSTGRPSAAAPAKDTGALARAELTYAGNLHPLFMMNCTPCHTGPEPKAKYDLTTYPGVMGTGSDEIPNVIPGKPDSSLLVTMLLSGKMPPKGPLPAPRADTIGWWVRTGAKNN